MAFISQLSFRSRRRSSGAKISFRKTATGCFQALVGKPTGLQGANVDIEIDDENKLLRVGYLAGGFKTSNVGVFSIKKSTFKLLSPISMESFSVWLSLGDDGWWYGSYAEVNHER